MKAMRPTRLAFLAAPLLAVTIALAIWVVATGSGTFEPEVDVELSDDEHDANADITTTFNIPGTDYQYAKFFAFTPVEFFPDEDVPIGAKVGHIKATATLGLMNGACSASLSPEFDLYWATTDTSSTVTFSEQFLDCPPPVGTGTLCRGVTLYPDFLIRMFPDLTPVERLFGATSISGQKVSINIVTFEAGALGGFPPSLGRSSVTVLNDIGDPGRAPAQMEAITDFCTPLETEIVTFGLSQDNPFTGDDEADHEVRRNPNCGGTYTFRWHAESMLDAEGDGYENYLDTCPFDDNVDCSPKEPGCDPDGDGIDSACEASMRASCDPPWDPTQPCWCGASPDTSDCDGDFFRNRGDNCPLVANDQADADTDNIGDVCDIRGNGPTTPDGEPIVVDPSVDVDISGPACGEATPTPTPTPTATPSVTGTVPATVTGTVTTTATTPPVEDICPPVIPGTYNGLVRLNGVPAPSGYEVIAKVGGAEWGSAVISGGRYAMDIPGHLVAAPPCFEAGALTFEINGATCTMTPATDAWASGLHDVDLSCAAAATATATATPAATTPAATPTKTATPTATPAKPPPTGGGGLGGDQGLPLWAMIVAGWASLMALAGVGTLVTRIVKR